MRSKDGEGSLQVKHNAAQGLQMIGNYNDRTQVITNCQWKQNMQFSILDHSWLQRAPGHVMSFTRRQGSTLRYRTDLTFSTFFTRFCFLCRSSTSRNVQCKACFFQPHCLAAQEQNYCGSSGHHPILSFQPCIFLPRSMPSSLLGLLQWRFSSSPSYKAKLLKNPSITINVWVTNISNLTFLSVSQTQTKCGQFVWGDRENFVTDVYSMLRLSNWL